MTDWRRNQNTSSLEEFMHYWNVRGGVQKVVGTTLKINVILMYLFLQ
jgi:hypothetical protein